MTYASILPLGKLQDIHPAPDRLHQWLKYFDRSFYKTFEHHGGVADLDDLNDEDLVLHFVRHGWRERRCYSKLLHSFIEPQFYREEYPELMLLSDASAISHWMYTGFFEGRIPNSVTKKLLESKIHLFQMGKVASKSLEHSIYESGCDGIIPHLHFASEMLTTYPNCLLSYQEIINAPRLTPLLFISGLRDPFERIISGYFEASENRSSSLPPNPSKQDAERFLERNVTRELNLILNWFEHKFYIGIDVYNFSFDRQRGFSVISGNGASLFLYRFDKLAGCWDHLSMFLGRSLNPIRVNPAETKSYHRIYSDVLRTMKFPANLVKVVLSSRYCVPFFHAQGTGGDAKTLGKALTRNTAQALRLARCYRDDARHLRRRASVRDQAPHHLEKTKGGKVYRGPC